MGKPKKGKKGRQEEDFGDDDAIVDPLAQVDTETIEAEPAPSQKAGKKGKKGKKANKDWSDDEGVNSKFEALSLDQGSDVENGEIEETQPVSGKSKKKGKKKKQKMVESEEEEEEGEEEIMSAPRGQGKPGLSAFAMLEVEEAGDEGMDEEEDEEIEEVKPVSKKKQKKKQKTPSVDEEEEMEEEKEEEETPAQSTQPQKKKGKKKKKEEEEDIDAILADIEKPAEKEGGKKKKKKKDREEFAPIPEPESATAFELVDLENMTQDQIAALLGGDDDEEDERKMKKKEKKKKKKGKEVEEEKEKEDEVKEEEEGAVKEEEEQKEGEEEGSTVKTAAQKKREKRERQKQQKLLEKQQQLKKQDGKKEEPVEKPKEEPEKPKDEESGQAEKKSDDEGEEDGDKKKKKKDKRKKKGEKEEKEEEKTKKKPGSKMLKAMQEALQKVKEDEERAAREEEERERKLEEARKAKEEEERLLKDKKEKERLKKKEKLERQKKEGTYKTKAQKEAEKRAREMLAARGLQLPVKPTTADGEAPRPKRIVYDRRKKNKFQKQGSEELKSPDEGPQSPLAETPTPSTEEKPIVVEETEEKPKVEEEEVLDSWELVDDGPEEQEKEEPVDEKKTKVVVKEKEAEKESEEESEEEEEESSEEEEEDESSSEEESSEDESSDDEDLNAEERAFRRAEKRIQKRKELAESKRNRDVLRAPVVCVLGHVDTGKTKILDKLRRTNVQDGEAGGITQQIGATNVPHEAIKDKTSMCKDFSKKELKLPGLLIIDTPGHESFSNLRNRGSSLCDIAILVVDIMHGLEPQTIESINLLKARKTPFVVALNKIDRLFGWQPNPHTDVINTLKKQKTNTKLEFDERVQMVTGKFAEQGLNVALFYENKNQREYISMVPTSAHSGDGMGNLVALICELSQTFLAERIAFVDDLQATVMEVKALPGLGTTIDVIVVNGSIRESQTMIVAGTEGPIVTQIRGLLLPQPMKELRVKGAYVHTKEMKAAQGVKIIAKDLDKSLAGLPLYVAKYDDEVAVYRAELEESLEEILKGIKVQQEGVFVQASTLGSLEALLEFLRTSKIPYAGINIGPVHKRDIMRASVMLERDSQYAVILAFDVKVEREAQDMADGLGVRIFTADIIYHLFDAFTSYRAELKKQKQEEFKHVAVFPCKLRVLPNCVFNARNPIVVGVNIEAGFVKEGTPLCVPSKEFVEIGRVASVEFNHKAVEIARKGQEVCIKIEPIPGEAPKLFGRHFDHTDLLVSKISRQSIDAVKNYFREDMTKTDWQLMVELKKTFEIL